MKCRLGIYRFGFLSIFLVVLAFCNHEITCVPESVGVIHITVRVVGMRPFPPLGRHAHGAETDWKHPLAGAQALLCSQPRGFIWEQIFAETHGVCVGLTKSGAMLIMVIF